MMSKVVLLGDLASSGLKHVPPKFIRPIADRPNLSDVQEISGGSIPLIDLALLHGPHRHLVVHRIGQACKSHGFFQVKNHGIPEEMMNNILGTARKFFKLPEGERLKNYSDDPTKTTRLSTSFNVKTEQVSSWRDFLRLDCHPIQDYIHQWPTSPLSFRNDVAEYSSHVRELAVRIVEAISESLGLERDHIVRSIKGQGQHMAMNYYPPCPEPELTYGLPGHTDPNLVTILLQDHVPGLQVQREGKWVAVNPIPNTFIVNIGDQMQVISNDRYKSVVHRAIVNSGSERISIPTFYCPSPEAVIGPAEELVDQLHPAVYRDFTYADYYGNFWNRGLNSHCCLDQFKLHHP